MPCGKLWLATGSLNWHEDHLNLIWDEDALFKANLIFAAGAY